MFDNTWRLVSESGGDAVEFSSMLTVSIEAGGQALTCPIEQGAFATYNKVQSPLSISLELGIGGEAYEQRAALDRLERMRSGLEKVALVTPYEYYPSLTLASFSHHREPGLANHALLVSLQLTEVREVGGVSGGVKSITRPKDPTSANPIDLGKTRTLEIAASTLAQMYEIPLPDDVRRILTQAGALAEAVPTVDINSSIKIF